MGSNVNIIILEGRLTYDPELKQTRKGKTLCSFSIANNRYFYRNGSFDEDVGFFKVVVWEKLADKCAEHLRKGKLVLVSGTLRQDSYVGKNGEKRYSVYVVAKEVKFLERANAAEKTVVTQMPTKTAREYADGEIPESLAASF